MSRVCEISGKSVMSGNNVSDAKNRTRRKFLPNLQNVKLYSKILDKFISMKVCVRSLKTVEKNGGLDNYLMKSSNRVLAPEAQVIKKTIIKADKKASSNIMSCQPLLPINLKLNGHAASPRAETVAWKPLSHL